MWRGHEPVLTVGWQRDEARRRRQVSSQDAIVSEESPDRAWIEEKKRTSSSGHRPQQVLVDLNDLLDRTRSCSRPTRQRSIQVQLSDGCELHLVQPRRPCRDWRKEDVPM